VDTSNGPFALAFGFFESARTLGVCGHDSITKSYQSMLSVSIVPVCYRQCLGGSYSSFGLPCIFVHGRGTFAAECCFMRLRVFIRLCSTNCCRPQGGDLVSVLTKDMAGETALHGDNQWNCEDCEGVRN
jgi:hypothetical protein